VERGRYEHREKKQGEGQGRGLAADGDMCGNREIGAIFVPGGLASKGPSGPCVARGARGDYPRVVIRG